MLSDFKRTIYPTFQLGHRLSSYLGRSKRNYATQVGDVAAQEAAVEAHAFHAMQTWRKISLYVALPMVCLVGIYTWSRELSKGHPHREFQAYPYLRIRVKV